MPRHIAIVKDEPAIRENYAAAIEKNGYGVSSYGERGAALEAYRTVGQTE
ncbi:MAG: hypothetical protein HKM98_08985 [Gammaproteobacteria bacterium]|nr:hypothetical protein [Gammaproteobacteria bacterium]